MKQVYNEILKQEIWQAEEGMQFKRKDSDSVVGTMIVKLATSDSIDNYEEVAIQTEEAIEQNDNS